MSTRTTSDAIAPENTPEVVPCVGSVNKVTRSRRSRSCSQSQLCTFLLVWVMGIGPQGHVISLSLVNELVASSNFFDVIASLVELVDIKNRFPAGKCTGYIAASFFSESQ